MLGTLVLGPFAETKGPRRAGAKPGKDKYLKTHFLFEVTNCDFNR